MVISLWLGSCVLISDADREARDFSRLDLDGDGFIGELDCDDDNPEVFPGQVELPNGIDDDCDGRIDNDTEFFDDDGDGWCERAPCRNPGCSFDDCSGDCDDAEPSVFPGAPEVCDGILNDCNRAEGEQGDADGDGWSVAQGDPDDRDRTVIPTDVQEIAASLACSIVRLPPDTYTRGCDFSWCDFDEGPPHQVTLTGTLLVMETEVLRRQYDRFAGAKNWAFPACGPQCPVTRVSWEEAQAFANLINDFQGLPRCLVTDDPRTCAGWRLPTEAEWEYAARGRSSDRYAGGSNASLVGWIAENSGNSVHPARLKLPNVHGLYDMTGNVWEWVWDLDQRYTLNAQVDPVALVAVDPPGELDRGLRGASGRTTADLAHVTTRSAGSPYAIDWVDTGNDAIDHNPNDPYNWVGFRLVRRAP